MWKAQTLELYSLSFLTGRDNETHISQRCALPRRLKAEIRPIYLPSPFLQAHTHTYTHTHARTHTYTHARTHTHVCTSHLCDTRDDRDMRKEVITRCSLTVSALISPPKKRETEESFMIQYSEYTDTCSLPNLFFPQQIFQPFVITRQWGQPLFPSPPFSIAVGVILAWGSLSFFFLMLVRLSFPFFVSWLVSLLVFLYRFTKLSILTVCDQIPLYVSRTCLSLLLLLFILPTFTCYPCLLISRAKSMLLHKLDYSLHKSLLYCYFSVPAETGRYT